MTKQSIAIRLAVVATLGACGSQTAQAANWFDIQTVSLPAWGYGKFLGFLEPMYNDIKASPASNGQVPKADYIAPTFDGSAGFSIQRARFFVRGSTGPDLSYYIGAEAGQNGYTYSFGNYGPKLIDANITINHMLPGGNHFEMGVIRAPGAEGAMEGFMTFNLLDTFPTGINQLLQPVFYSKNVTYATASGSTANASTTNATATNPTGGYLTPGSDLSGNNGFRYPGAQIENWFMVSPKTEVAYGLMAGVYGRQFESSTWNGPIFAGRVQASYLLNKRPGRFFRDDITTFAWYQQAHPEMNGVANTMIRDGAGFTYRKGYMQPDATSLKMEFFNGTGLIDAPAAFLQVPGVTTPAQYDSTFYPGSSNRAYGYAASGGLFLTRNVELNLRYDYYDRLPNLAAQERIFKNYTAAVEYHFTPLSRIVADFQDHKVLVPNPGAIGKPGSAPVNLAESAAAAVGNKFDVYGVWAF